MPKWYFAYWFQGSGSGDNGTYLGNGGGGGGGDGLDSADAGDGRAPGILATTGGGTGVGPGGITNTYVSSARAMPREDS